MADSLHPLGAAQLAFGLVALGYIAGGADDPVDAAIEIAYRGQDAFPDARAVRQRRLAAVENWFAGADYGAQLLDHRP